MKFLAARRRAVFTGQSMFTVPGPPRDIPTMAADAAGIADRQNIAIGGSGWAALMDDSTHMAQLEAGVRNLAGYLDTLVMCSGHGDIWLEDTGEEVYDLAVEYAEIARGHGYGQIIAVAGPAMATGFYPAITSEMVTEWVDYNARLVSNADGAFDLVVNAMTTPLDNATNFTYFVVDRVHLKQSGGQELANRITAALLQD